MHIQARVSPKRPDPGDDDTGDETSTTYRVGALEEILRVLEDGDFNIRSTTGSKIELGGEFGFALGRDGDDDHEQRTKAAVKALRGEGFRAHIVDVQTRLLDDTPGALRAFVADVSADGLLIEEIAVGTPARDGRIPVQIYTARAESEADEG
jgi:hypothetical protein